MLMIRGDDSSLIAQIIVLDFQLLCYFDIAVLKSNVHDSGYFFYKHSPVQHLCVVAILEFSTVSANCISLVLFLLASFKTLIITTQLQNKCYLQHQLTVLYNSFSMENILMWYKNQLCCIHLEFKLVTLMLRTRKQKKYIVISYSFDCCTES